MFLRKAEGDAWPDLSDHALAARREDWLVPMLHDKTSVKDLSASELSEALTTLLPWELRARLEREAPTHFEAPTGSHACDRLRGRAGADHRGQIAGTIRVDHASVDCERQGCRWCWNCCRRRTGRSR